MANQTDGTRMATRIAEIVVLTICAVGLPDHSHAQPPPEVPVQDTANLSVSAQLMLTLQMVLAPGTLNDGNSFYAYDPVDLQGSQVYPDRIGDVATISPCNNSVTENSAEEVAWCARYFNGNDAVRQAYDTAVAGVEDSDDDTAFYFATTRPLPNIPPSRQFVVPW